MKKRRRSKRKKKHLGLTCKTPVWMQKWVTKEPELYSDDSD